MIKDEFFGSLINSCKTPAFIFDEDELRSRAFLIRSILGDDISLCYSVKANAFLVPALLDIVDFFEVCSPGEFDICTKLSVPCEKILYSGVHKDMWDVKRAVSYDSSIITAESKKHYELIKAASKETGKKTRVILRLSSGNQFGMSKEDIIDILKDPAEGVDIAGIHYFAGTGRSKLKRQMDELEKLDLFLGEQKERFSGDMPFFEYGPGLPFPYFEDEDRSDTLLPLKELAPKLLDLSKKYTVSIEMGRFLASSCGYYITSVSDIKTSNGVNYCIVDGGINHVSYLGQMIGMKVPVIRHFSDGRRVDDTDGEIFSICGSLCTINDVLVRSFAMRDPKEGDVLLFENIGAYSVTEAYGLFLSRPLPYVYMLKDGKLKKSRELTETWDINMGWM